MLSTKSTRYLRTVLDRIEISVGLPLDVRSGKYTSHRSPFLPSDSRSNPGLPGFATTFGSRGNQRNNPLEAYVALRFREATDFATLVNFLPERYKLPPRIFLACPK